MLLKQHAFPRLSIIRAWTCCRPFALLCLLVTVSLTSHAALAEKKLRVVTTFTIIQDIAQNVGVDVRPAVGAGGDQTLVQRLLGGAHVRDLGGFGGTDLQHRVRLFGASSKDAARARVLEAAADDVDAVGQQGCGQCVAFKALVGLAVERKRQDLVAVDPATVGQAIGLAHTFSPVALAVNCGLVPIL